MKKMFLVLMAILLLNSCWYSDGCFYSPQNVSCLSKGRVWPYIATFQKKNSIGYTNSEERWHDAIGCGAININKSENKFDIKGERNKYDVIIPEVVDKFENCMEKKGYYSFSLTECGYQSSSWNTGKCNL